MKENKRPAPEVKVGTGQPEEAVPTIADRRKLTSVHNLAGHIHMGLGEEGHIISAKLPVSMIALLDRARGSRTRSECLREAIDAWLEVQR